MVIVNFGGGYGGLGSLYYFLYFCKYLKTFITKLFGFFSKKIITDIDPCVLTNPLDNDFNVSKKKKGRLLDRVLSLQMSLVLTRGSIL